MGMQPTTVLLDVSRGSVKEEEEEEEEEKEEKEEEDEAIQAGRLLCRPSKGAEQPGGE